MNATRVIAFDDAAQAWAAAAAGLGLMPAPAQFAKPGHIPAGFTLVHHGTARVWRVEGRVDGQLPVGDVRLVCQHHPNGVRMRYLELRFTGIGRVDMLARLRELAGEIGEAALILDDGGEDAAAL